MDLALALHAHLAVLLRLRPVPGLAMPLVEQGCSGSTATGSRSWRRCTSSDLADDRIGRILRDHIRRMDHVELLSGVLAGEGQERKLATWVLGEEVRHVQNLAIDHDPAITLGSVLGHLGQGDSTIATATGCGSSACRSSTPSATDHSNDSVRSVLRDHIRRVDHVELLSGVLAREGQNRKLATWVLGEEVRHVQHLAVDHDPAIALGSVLGHLVQGVAAATDSGRSTYSCSSTIHRAL